ncbi:MAG: hypothetical protein RIC89_03620 [Pseudomonadales bacterium]
MAARVKRMGVRVLFALSMGLLCATANAIEVDLNNFPSSGAPVPNNTILDDQWRVIGILFDALPSPAVNPVRQDFGGADGNLFFSPDNSGVTAVFTFVEPGTFNPAQATSFSLRPFFNPGESAELVGLDALDQVVASDTVTSGDIGASDRSITMSIAGVFDRVEWRTQGNPGIAAGDIRFTLIGGSEAQSVPVASDLALVLLSLALAMFAVVTLAPRTKQRG